MTTQIAKEETCCRHMGYYFRLAARVLLYASSLRQDSTYHGICYTSRRSLARTRNSLMGPPHEGAISRSNQCSTTGVTKPWYVPSCIRDGAYKRTLAANRKE